MRDDWLETSLFDDEWSHAKRTHPRAPARASLSAGILPHQRIAKLIASKQVAALQSIEEAQLQPASLDLRLGRYAHRIRASFLPGTKQTLRSQLPSLEMHRLNLEEGAILEKNAVYLVELQESVDLPTNIAAIANPKSSTGRIDVFVRLITDLTEVFDYVEPGYKGPLWAEISPRSFAIKVQQGSRLNQLRFRQIAKDQKSSSKRRQHRSFGLTDPQLQKIDDVTPLVTGGPKTIRRGLHVSVNLLGEGNGLLGYKAKRNTAIIDVEKVGAHRVEDFWEPVRAESNGRLILDPLEFYILASQEALSIPPSLAAEMVPIDPLMGEFRVHYAGFFDPGFGYSKEGKCGSRAVLEVRSHEVPFFLEHGQTVGRLVYERLVEPPVRLYGSGIGSNYQGQGLKLSKHFSQDSKAAALASNQVGEKRGRSATSRRGRS
jgi:dCTP deaminase